MGGCRCTYRNCTVKSDGKTHMFHYPVFEKLRCHKWLLNAQRLEFLNLKVSQLKNRVVCQHHFKEECFMNYMREKLTFDAIPTENGPFCDLTKWSTKVSDPGKTYPIILEDIENDCLPFCDKKANLSLKYGDFLTNCELMDFDDNEVPSNINIKNENTVLKNVITEHNADRVIFPNNRINQKENKKVVLPIKIPNKPLAPNKPEIMAHPYNDVNIFAKDSLYIPENKSVDTISKNDATPVVNVKKEPKIKIISEKKIEEPIIVLGNFTKVSPSRTLIPNSCNDSLVNEENEMKDKNMNGVDGLSIPIENTFTVQVGYEVQPNNNKVTSNADESKLINSTKPQTNDENSESKILLLKNDDAPPESKILLLKSKITPERMALIENKRKFNMKLKDVVEACLDKKDYDVKTDTPNTEKITRNTSKRKLAATSQTQNPVVVQSCLPSEPVLPNVHDNTLTYLEERLKNMENTLLNKIDQNSHKIAELKTCVGTQKKQNVKKVDTYAQTCESEESYKRFLYCEISKYLSSSCNSAIYEELFINKFSLNEPGYSLRNKRKKRS